MSAIKDALSRVQQQRKETVPIKPAPRFSSRRQPEGSSNRPARTPLYVWVLANLAVLIAVFASYYFFFRQSPATKQLALVSPAPLATRPETRLVPAPLSPKPTPNIPQSRETPRVVAAPEPALTSRAVVSLASDVPPVDTEYELSGMTAVGKNTLLSITRVSDRSSTWVTVGKTVGEVTAVSYNAEANDARIQVRGRLVTIRRR